MEEDEVDDELSEAADTEVIKQFALMLSPGRNRAATLSAINHLKKITRKRGKRRE